jgi:nucleoside phosphorylase
MRRDFAAKPNRGLPKKDFAIIATLDEEFSAVRRNMSAVSKTHNDIPFKYYDCTLEQEKFDPLEGLVFQPHDSGRVESSILTTYILSRFQIRLLILCGIAGGLKSISQRQLRSKSDSNLGDVVFAHTLVDTEFKKISSVGVEYRDRVFHVSGQLVDLFTDFWDERNLSIGRPLALAIKGTHRVEAHIGMVVSGNKVVASTKDQESIGRRANNVGVDSSPLAVEMEGIGVAVAAWRFGYKDKFFMIRGISDFANENKGSDEAIWRHKACNNAALTTVEFLRFLSTRRNWSRHSNRVPLF